MAPNADLHALRRIADTSRKIRRTTPTTPISNIAAILKSLPEHKPLLPLLLSHGIPSKLATVCSDRYDRCANELRSATETKLTPYLINRRENPPEVVYPLFLSNYIHALRDWAQSILDTALKCLKHNPVDLSNWNMTYPVPLWLPLPLDTYPEFTRKELKKPCPLSSICTPPHTFPTIYPPPFRPQSRFAPIEWSRTPSAPPRCSSTSIIDIDSLCTRLTRSLVIDENPTRSSQSKTPIFSLPPVSKEGCSTTSSHTKRSKRRVFRDQAFPNPSTSKHTPTTSLKATKPRPVSLPPSFPLSVQKARPVSRKVSAPTSHRPRRATSTSTLDPLDPHPSRGTPPPTRSSPTDPSDAISSLGPVTPHSLELRFDSLPDPATPVPQYSPASSTGPSTPPALSPELFSDPVVVSPTPAQLFPNPFLGPLTDPFIQFQMQPDYLLEGTLISSFDYPGSMFSYTTDDFSPKTTFDFSGPGGPFPVLHPLPCDPFAPTAVST